eukprot:scaffold99284_cov50-Phaeocystis_antarctica.AAC.3
MAVRTFFDSCCSAALRRCSSSALSPSVGSFRLPSSLRSSSTVCIAQISSWRSHARAPKFRAGGKTERVLNTRRTDVLPGFCRALRAVDVRPVHDGIVAAEPQVMVTALGGGAVLPVDRPGSGWG